jgi:class 3 adenylate cyclase
VGVHTGPAYVGTAGPGASVNEIAVLGSAANLAARLSSSAGQGEVLISQAALDRADQNGEGMESRELEVKGVSESITVHVMSRNNAPQQVSHKDAG